MKPRLNSYERDDGILSDDPVSSTRQMTHHHHSSAQKQVNKSLNNPYRHRAEALHMEENTTQMYQTQDDKLRQMALAAGDPMVGGLPPQPS